MTDGGGAFGDAFNARGAGTPNEEGDRIKTERKTGASGTGSFFC